jgi:hypothetical protein
MFEGLRVCELWGERECVVWFRRCVLDTTVSCPPPNSQDQRPETKKAEHFPSMSWISVLLDEAW